MENETWCSTVWGSDPAHVSHTHEEWQQLLCLTGEAEKQAKLVK